MAIIAPSLLLLLGSCKKDFPVSSAERHEPPISTTPQKEYDEYLINGLSWEPFSTKKKFITVPIKAFGNFSNKSSVYIQIADTNSWKQLTYVALQNVYVDATPDFYYSFTLDYANYLPIPVFLIFAETNASIDFSKAVKIRIRVYR